jgi:hypothetical protein
VLFKGETCEEAEEELPSCLDTWELPYKPPDGDDFHMWTLNRETITNKNMHLLNLGKYDDREDVVVQLTSQVGATTLLLHPKAPLVMFSLT